MSFALWSLGFLMGYFGCRNTWSEYIGHVRVSRSWVQGQDHGSEKSVACKTTGWKLIGLDRNICYDNTRRDLTFDL